MKAARRVVRLAALLVPRAERRAWRAEWEAELDVLEHVGGGGGPAGARLPSPLGFALGAIPHAIWTRWEGWTMDGMFQDLKYAFRTLRRAPGFAAVAAFTLALGIGANASIFTLVNGLVLSAPTGVDEPGDMVFVARTYDSAPRWDNWSYPAFRTIAEETKAFSDVMAHTIRPVLLGQGAEARFGYAEYVSGSYFGTLGVSATAGRVLGPADDPAGGGIRVAVLGHDHWVSAFGSDRGVVGSTVRIGGESYDVVGVAEPGFRGTDILGVAPDVYLPLQQAPIFGDYPVTTEWGTSFLNVSARLGSGETVESAGAALDVVSMRMRELEPDNGDIRALVAGGFGLPPSDRAEAETISWILIGIAALVLLLTCANVANLFIARATTRVGEMGVRLALGAGRARLGRQLITESVVIGAGSALLAVPLVALTSGVIPGLLPYSLATPPSLDVRVFAVIAGLGIVAGLLFGAVPALSIAGRDLARSLRENGSTAGAPRTMGRDALAVAQIAVSLALVTAAGLLGRSVLNGTNADPGFDPDGVFVASLAPASTGRYGGAEATALVRRITDEAAGLPGVTATAVSTFTPFFGGMTRWGISPGVEFDEEAMVEMDAYEVSPDYFATLGVEVVAGRVHEMGEGVEGDAGVALVNRTLVERFFPGEDPVGRQLATSAGRPLRVIGVVEDVQSRSLRGAPTPAFYMPLPAQIDRAVVHLRVQGEAAAMAEPFRALVASIDQGLPVASVADLQSRMEGTLGTTRSLGVLVTIFAGLALLLSMIGLYGLVAFAVARRTREFGIRMALGSSGLGLVRLVVSRAALLAGVGVLAGSVLAVGLARGIRGSLFGVDPFSPGVLVVGSVLLVGTSVLAAWLPALRATRVDATVAFRD